MSALYLFGVVRHDHPLPHGLETIAGGSEPRLLPLGDLAVVVSDVPEAVLRARDALVHMRVVDAIFATGTVLPFRFGVVAPDEASLRAELAPQETLYAARLQELDGLVEIAVNARHDEDALLRDVLEGSAQVRSLSAASRAGGGLGAQLALGETVAGEVGRRREADGAWLLERLAPLARTVAPRGREGATVLRASFLVERAAVPRFEEEVRSLEAASGAGLRVELRQLPPYSFSQPMRHGSDAAAPWGS